MIAAASTQNQDSTALFLIPSANFKALTLSLTKKEALDEKVEKALNQVIDDTLSEVLELACRLAKHRGGRTLARNDVRMAFEKRLKVRVPLIKTVSTAGP